MAHCAAKKSAGETGEKQSASEQSAQKDEYLKRKQENARRRQNEKRKVQVEREIKKAEARLIEIEDELFGDAASDYIRAAALSDEKITVEDHLMQLYEEEELLNNELPEKEGETE